MPLSGQQTIDAVRARENRTLLAFSRGKDAIAAWLAIREHFDEVIPYHLDLIPGLEFVDESVAYFERFFGTKILRMPHPSLYRWLNGYLFQPPERCAVIDQAGLPDFDYPEVREDIVAHRKLSNGIMVADGVRAADSPMRRIAIQTHGPISWSLHKYHPVWDWNKARVLESFEKHGVKLPIDYMLFGRTFDGLDLRFLLPLKKHVPRDYKRVLDWFPLAELEIKRYEYAGYTA